MGFIQVEGLGRVEIAGTEPTAAEAAGIWQAVQSAKPPPAPTSPGSKSLGVLKAIGDVVPNYFAKARQNALDEVRDPRAHLIRQANEAGQSTFGRAAMGMTDPVTGIVQLLANATGRGAGVNQFQADIEAAYAAGRDKVGNTGLDLARFGGNIVNPLTVASGGLMGAPTSVLSAIRLGAIGGGAFGLTAPVGETDSYLKSKAEQVGFGAAAGGFLGPIGYGVSRIPAFFGKGAKAARERVRDQASKYADILAQKADKGVAGVTNDVAVAAAGNDASVTKLNQQIADILDQRATAQAAADKGIAGQQATVAALSKQLEAYQNTLGELEKAAVPTQNMGIPGLRTPTGEDAISAVTAQRKAIAAARTEADDAIRPVVENIVAEGERSGKAVADLPSAQALLKQSKDYLNAPPADAGRVAERAASPLTGIHQKIVDAIETQSMELTAAEAAEAKAAGQVVRTEAAGQPTYTVTVPGRRGASAQEIPAKSAKEATELARQTGGKVNEGPLSEVKYYRDFENSFEALNNLARHLGDSYQKDMEGFGGVPTKLMRDKSAALQSVLTEYVDQFPGGKGLRQQLQDNWAQHSKLIDAGDTGVAKVLGNVDASAPGAIDAVAARGAEGLREFSNSSISPEATYNVANEIIKRALYSPDKPMDLATAQRVLGANTALRDMVEALPDILGSRGAALKDKVERYMTHLAEKQEIAELVPGAKATIKATEGDVKRARASAAALEKDAAKNYKVSAMKEAKIVNKELPKAEQQYLAEQEKLTKAMNSAIAVQRRIGRLQSDLRNDVVKPDAILEAAESVFKRMADDGHIPQDKYVDLMKMAAEAQKMQDKKAAFQSVLKAAATLAAVGGGGWGAYHVLNKPTTNIINMITGD